LKFSRDSADQDAIVKLIKIEKVTKTITKERVQIKPSRLVDTYAIELQLRSTKTIIGIIIIIIIFIVVVIIIIIDHY